MNNEVYNHKHICLVEDHYNPLGIVRSLGENGIRPIVLLCNPKPHLVNKSKYIGELHVFPTIEEAFDFMVSNYGNEPLKPFVYNGSDNLTLLLDKHYDEIKDRFYFTNGCGGIDYYMQKYNLIRSAADCGLLIPNEELLKVGELPKTLNYPVFTKAVTSTKGGDWKAQSFICEKEQELLDAYKDIHEDTILVQEYIKKKNELCLDGFSINGGEQVIVPYASHYFRFSEKGYGNYMWFFPFRDNDIMAKCQKLLKRAKFSGIFSIEFLVGPDDKNYFLEVNFRNSTWSYAFAYGGYNLPFNWAVSTLEGTINTSSFVPKERFTAMAEVDDMREFVVQRKEISLKQWIKDAKSTDVFYIYNKKDMKPFWSELKFQIKHQINKRILKRE